MEQSLLSSRSAVQFPHIVCACRAPADNVRSWFFCFEWSEIQLFPVLRSARETILFQCALFALKLIIDCVMNLFVLLIFVHLV